MAQCRAGTGRVVWVILMMAGLSLAAAGGNGHRHGELVLEDSDLASWTTIRNTFNQDPGHTPWDGVLIQLGEYLDEGKPLDRFESITFEDERGALLTLHAEDFRWIDIVAVDPARSAPMGPQHLFELYPEAGTTSGCSDFDACALESCSCSTPPCKTAAYEPLGRCVRSRSLHGVFTPFAVITYWQGPRGFELRVEPTLLGQHSRQVFSFNDPVQIFMDGQLLTVGRIDSIHVNAKGCPRCEMHGASTDPPWFP